MTFEQRTLIDPSDVIGIEYACTRCGSRHMIPLNKYDGAISNCPNCREVIVSNDIGKTGGASTDAGAVRIFVEAIAAIQKRGIPIKLEISSSVRASSGKD